MPRVEKGFALIIVIWILTLLSLMAGSFAKTMRREGGVTVALKNNAAAIALTESSFSYTRYMLLQPNIDDRWVADGTVYQFLRRDGSKIRIKIISESGKIDINTASENLLSAAITAAGVDKWEQQSLLDAILDWRDEDNETRPRGAERKQYEKAGLSYIPNDMPFQSLEELQMVMGMNQALFSRMQPLITIYSGQAEVNYQVAPIEVLQAISNELASRHVHDPALEQALSAYSNPNDLSKSKNGNTGGDAAVAGDNQSQTYTIIVEVQMDDNTSASLEVVTRLQSEATEQGLSQQILDWKQNQIVHSLFAEDMETKLLTVQDEFTNNN
jgi:general secretion pathway protein K